MRVTRLAAGLLVALLVASTLPAAFAQLAVDLSVSIVKVIGTKWALKVVVYAYNETSGAPLANATVTVEVYKPNGTLVYTSTGLTDLTGTYSIVIPAQGFGNVTVVARVTWGNETVEVSKVVTPAAPVSKPMVKLMVSPQAVAVLLSRVKLLLQVYGNDTLWALYNESLALYESGNYSAAFELLKEIFGALKEPVRIRARIRERLGNVTALNYTPGAIGLETAIERHLEHIERMEQLLEKLAEKGFNVTEALAVLEEAKAELEKAASMIGEYNTSEIARMIANATRKIGLAMRSVKKCGRWLVRERALRAVDKLLEVVDKLPEDVRKRLLERLNSIKKVLESGNFTSLKYVMWELAKVRKEIREQAPHLVPKPPKKPPLPPRPKPPHGKGRGMGHSRGASRH